MCSKIVDLATKSRHRPRPAVPCSAFVSRSDRQPSIEIERADLRALASPPALAQLAMLLDDECVELQYIPRATLIERLRFHHSSDEFAQLVRVTLER